MSALMSPNAQTGLLLINLGTPASPHPRDVRSYLDEFLNGVLEWDPKSFR